MSDLQTIDVTALEKADAVRSGDTLLLVRQNDDGTQTALRVDGQDFRGEDAYAVAKAAGYTGSYEEWTQHVRDVAETDVSVDAATGEIVIRK